MLLQQTVVKNSILESAENHSRSFTHPTLSSCLPCPGRSSVKYSPGLCQAQAHQQGRTLFSQGENSSSNSIFQDTRVVFCAIKVMYYMVLWCHGKENSFFTVHKLLPESRSKSNEELKCSIEDLCNSGSQLSWASGAKWRERNMMRNNECEKAKLSSVLLWRLLTFCSKGTKRMEREWTDSHD